MVFCVSYLRGVSGGLEEILCVHVDDTICGGSRKQFRSALNYLRSRFPFRTWKSRPGCFRGLDYEQNSQSKVIAISSKEFSVRRTNGAAPQKKEEH